MEGDAAARLNAAFFMMMRQARPWVIAKAGVSADGRVAAGAGVRTAITSTAVAPTGAAAARGGRRYCGGSRDCLVDDPLLTVREVFQAAAADKSGPGPAAAHTVVGAAAIHARLRAGRGGDDGRGPGIARRGRPSALRQPAPRWWRPTARSRGAAGTGGAARAIGAGRGRSAGPCRFCGCGYDR